MKIAVAFLVLIPTVLLTALTLDPDLGEVKRYDYRVEVYTSPYVMMQIPQFIYGEKDFCDLNSHIEKLAEGMYRSWEKELVDNIKEGFASRTRYYLSFQMRRIDERIVSLTLEDYAFLGGAHGNGVLKAINFDIKTCRLLKLSDLFKLSIDYKSQINRWIKDYFERVKTLKDFEGIGDDQEFFMTDEGLVIFFQKYEYTPYSQGCPMIFIPYGSLKGFKGEYLPVR